MLFPIYPNPTINAPKNNPSMGQKGVEVKITKKWIEKQHFNEDFLNWFSSQKETSGASIIKSLRAENEFELANWLFVNKLMSYKQYVSYAVFSIEQVMDIYEKKYPNDRRPRQTIKAVKKCIANPSKKNKDSARAAGRYYTHVADGAAEEVGFAVNCAVTAATFCVAPAAGVAALKAYIVGGQEVREKIFNYGIKLLEVRDF